MKTLSTIKNWIRDEFAQSDLQITRISFDASKQWQWTNEGFLKHVTGRFFNVVGVRSFSASGGNSRTQPIIDQSEIGLLAFIVFKDAQDWWILAHAKVEPGNVNGAQLAPTVQATKSNYEIAHGGRQTPYLSIVQSARQPLYDQLQSEQNSRFLAKRNRNRVVRLNEKVDAFESCYKWVRLRDFLPMLGESHMVNTDARSVLSCWLFTDMHALQECLPRNNELARLIWRSLASQDAFHEKQCLADWLDTLNKKWYKEPQLISLKDLDAPWICGDSQIFSPDDPSLMIYHIAVSCNKREVTHWDQPIVGSDSQTRILLYAGTYKGTLHLLLQAKLEAGNRKAFELTTTVQADTSDISKAEKKYIAMADRTGRTLFEFDNSEEGGRFDRCISRYQIFWMDEISADQEDSFHRWVSFSQFSDYLKEENIITNELRSAISVLLSIR